MGYQTDHFNEILPGLLKHCRGQWVLITSADQFIGTFKTEASAKQYGTQVFGDQAVFVREIKELPLK